MKYIFGFLLFCLLPMRADAVALNGRVGLFIPESSDFREIYDSALVEYQLELDHPLPWLCCFDGFINAGYLKAYGESEPLGISCRVRLIPVSFGCKYHIWSCRGYDGYVGLGAVYSWLDEKNFSDSYSFHDHSHGLGAVLKCGFDRTWRCFQYGLYLDYRYQKITNNGFRVNLGGLSAGGSLRYAF